eukprot:CAMPEP_0183743894 /NCGR_PEP_ID=MMETSP0737-20130205/65452_1 /TAXON_ID=385413 /ORGANISM="Thalassiosira miniscula, Strain CCMP1093" /LENGTH=344 /DNA_ID=CAMNT_0025979523 /DNA_START=101 /DNA_END=1136 /DNA_ORIENTATION=+
MSTIMRFISSSITTALSDQQQSQQGQQSQQSQFQSSSIANLSSRDRESLIHDIATEINDQDVESSLVHLEHTLDQCHVSLVEFEKKERFVGLRLERYKGLMWRREERMAELMEKIQQQNNGGKQRSSSPSSFSSLHENDTRSFLNEDTNIIDDDETDLENNTVQTQPSKKKLQQQLTTLQTKHAIDTQSLLGVEELHKNLIVADKGLMWRREERMKELMEKIQQQNNGQQKQRSSSPSSFSSLHENDTRSFLNEDDNIINDETDLENNALQTQTTLKQQLTTLQTKHAIDTQSLLGVEGLHKNLIVQIEVLRRRIRELETKQDDIARRKEECRDFLIAASAEFT